MKIFYGNVFFSRLRVTTETKESELIQKNESLISELESIKKSFSQKILFDDSKYENFNKLNLPPYEKSAKVKNIFRK